MVATTDADMADLALTEKEEVQDHSITPTLEATHVAAA